MGLTEMFFCCCIRIHRLRKPRRSLGERGKSVFGCIGGRITSSVFVHRIHLAIGINRMNASHSFVYFFIFIKLPSREFSFATIVTPKHRYCYLPFWFSCSDFGSMQTRQKRRPIRPTLNRLFVIIPTFSLLLH